MEKFSYILCMALFVWYVSCSDITTAGGSSSEVVASVAGNVFTSDGTTQEGISVELIPSEFNPLTESTDAIYRSSTDSAGSYQFDSIRAGIYNLYAQNPHNASRILYLGITVDSKNITVEDKYLKQPASMTIGLPKTADTIRGYILIKGTLLKWPVKKVFEMSDGSLAITIDSLPAGEIPSITYMDITNESLVTLAGTVFTKENDTVATGIDSLAKPLWTIPLIVGITDSTVSYFGGIDSIKVNIIKYIDAVKEKFNLPSAFKGYVNFRVDSIYSFTGSCSQEINKPYPDHFKLRLIMDAFSIDNIGYWSYPNQTAYEAAKVENFFKKISVSAIAWQFGLSRGCIPSSYMLVPASGNPINNTAFTGEQRFMYYPYTESLWDKYNVYAVNHYRANVISSVAPNVVGFPASMSIITVGNTEEPVSGARISLFGVKWASRAVTDTLLNDTTDSSGSLTLAQNPYLPDIHGKTTYCNILIRAVSVTDTAYSWMPIDEAGIAYFENPDQNFRKIIRFAH